MPTFVRPALACLAALAVVGGSAAVARAELAGLGGTGLASPAEVASPADDRGDRVSRNGTRPMFLSEVAQATASRATALTHTQLEIGLHERALRGAEFASLRATAERQLRRAERLGYDPKKTAPRDIAKRMMRSDYDWGKSEFACLDKIFTQESQWKWNATNPSSGAYGIPQSLPASKLASAGKDWKTNPATQIKWGLGYIKDRYGTPCKAWAFKRGAGWY